MTITRHTNTRKNEKWKMQKKRKRKILKTERGNKEK